jgi:hypothetical protein
MGQFASKARTLTVTVLPSEIMSPVEIDLNGDGVQTVSLAQRAGAFDLLNTRKRHLRFAKLKLWQDRNRNHVIDAASSRALPTA